MLPNIIILSVIVFAIIVLILFKKKLDGASFKYLLLFLSVNLSFEIVAFYLTQHSLSNVTVYNLEMVFEVTFFLLLYRRTALTLNYRKGLTVAAISFVTFAMANIMFLQGISVFNSNTYTLGSFILIFSCGIYLFNFIKKNEDKNPLFSLMFWISLGVLFCYLGNLPFLTNVNQLFAIDEDLALRLSLISISVNVLLYLLITVGTICNRKL